MLIPAIAAVQFVFSLACAVLLAGVNVFFRDIAQRGTPCAATVVLPLAGAVLVRGCRRAARWRRRQDRAAEPVDAVLFESYRDVIYNETMPNWLWLFALLVGSTIFLGLAMVFFKRVEPSFAKVL